MRRHLMYVCELQVDGEFPPTTRTLQEEGNLTIVHLNTDDQGVYECIATNDVARTVTTALLIIHGTNPNAAELALAPARCCVSVWTDIISVNSVYSLTCDERGDMKFAESTFHCMARAAVTWRNSATSR